jgi:phospho-N-acetylmuramoyl-pentapeptide-transferase
MSQSQKGADIASADIMADFLLFILTAAAVFALTVLISRKLIPVLKSKKMGQTILEIGPRWHKSKEGTPTMGGMAFIIASAITSAAALVYLAFQGRIGEAAPFIITVAYGIISGLIGCIDDLAKLRHHQNEGLTSVQKYLLQSAAAVLFIVGMSVFCGMTTEIEIPFLHRSCDIGIFFYPVAFLLLTGIDNSVNLTDGIDGLCSSVTLVVAVFFAAVSFFLRGGVSLSLTAAVMIGSTAGFLVYNFYPARVFMGDTGSLFLGALAVGAAFISGSPLIIVVAGIVYIAEAASDIIQVGYFKLTHGKRIFKMAPIHHHFEKCGWSEIKIVAVFTAVTAIASVIGWFGL